MSIKSLIRGVASLLLLAQQAGLAQPVSCSETDYQCLQLNMESACREPGSTRNSCEAWLNTQESHQFSTEPNWRLSQAWTYMSLADYAVVNSLNAFGSVTPQEASGFRQRAKEIFQSVADENPSNSEALQSLVLVTDSPEQRIEYLRRVVAIDPGNFIAVESLVSELQAVHGQNAFSEITELLEAITFSMDAIPLKWVLAEKTYNFLVESGNGERRNDFLSKLAADIGLNTIVAELSSRELNERDFRTLCDPRIIRLYGSAVCLGLIDIVMMDILETASRDRKARHAHAVVVGMTLASGSQDLQMNEPLWQTIFKSNLESLISLEIPLASLYEALASYVEGDERIAALQSALELAPENGNYRYRLALIYMEQKQWESAIEQFQLAREFLPVERHGFLDMQIQMALSSLSEELQ